METVRKRSVCPHDCPSVCALDIEVLNNSTIGRVYGAKDHPYTDGVICAKVSRYAERVHHPQRLMYPLMRKRGKSVRSKAASIGERPDPIDYERVSWDDALDQVAERFTSIIETHGSEAIWPYFFAGTMGLVQRDGLERFRRAIGASRMHATFCTTLPEAGWVAGAGKRSGSDVRLMEKSELVVIWGGNPVNTQVNVMNYIAKARRTSNAKVVVVDPYRTRTAEKADMHLMLNPGTDGALACAVMHILFRDNLADREYLEQYTDVPGQLEQHLQTRTPGWAAAITGLPVEEIEVFAKLYGSTKRSFLRLGYGFARSRNGAVNMHAASCLPAVSGAWRVEGGGALYGNKHIYPLNTRLIRGEDIACNTRIMDQSRIGEVLCGNPSDLQGGPAVSAILVQNTNPAVVAPDSKRVLQGLQREDLFTVVHEQFMTETAALADVILPATMFLEHDDIYTASGHTFLQYAGKLINTPGECRSNHQLLQGLAARLGLEHEGFDMTERQIIDKTMEESGIPAVATWSSDGYDCTPSFEDANFLNGFPTDSGKFRFAPPWESLGSNGGGMPPLPDHWDSIDNRSDDYPFRLVAAPARQFLNTSFTETESARQMEGKPLVRIHPHTLLQLGLKSGDRVKLGNQLGEVVLECVAFDGVQLATVVVESIWPNYTFERGVGINALISSEPGKPDGGAVFHDTAVWVRGV
ncbi:dehydrogenase [Chromatiales bacterium (ex Bugula neritina AB1)]|nr:dehydrogenase [Chromatiales bacterium (ex Bugula neritina AB1)]